MSGPERFAIIPAAYVFLLRERDFETEVLLQWRSGTGYMDDHWAAAAAGHVERGESVRAAARREALEEIGVTDLALDFLTSMQRSAGGAPIDERIDFFFAARRWRGEPRIMEPSKSTDLRWWPLTALPRPVVPHELQVLEGVRDGGLEPLLARGFAGQDDPTTTTHDE